MARRQFVMQFVRGFIVGAGMICGLIGLIELVTR